jgi:hypothetical protein
MLGRVFLVQKFIYLFSWNSRSVFMIATPEGGGEEGTSEDRKWKV